MKKKKKQPPAAITPEWPHRVETARIGTDPFAVKIVADPQQRKDMARRAGIASVERLEAEMILRRASGNNLIHVTGHVDADITQLCAVTLAPLQNQVSEEFEAWYTDHEEVISLSGVRRERKSMLSGGEMPVAEEHEDPEPAIDGAIDAGELAAQYFCLAIDPYPQGKESNYENSVETGFSAAPATRQNPFAALKNWKAGRGGEKA